MRTVYLHVGQPKTGTSYIQSVLLNNADNLAAKSIHYPLPRNPENAAGYGVNSGNLRTHQIMRRFDKIAARSGVENILFSSEFLYREEFYKKELFPFLKERGVRIKVLLYIRNPVSQLLSVYQQAIKRTKFSGTVDEFVFAPRYDWRDYGRAEDFVARCEEFDVDLTVHNFTERRQHLMEDVQNWLGLPIGTLTAPDIVVNRGLSYSEIEVMRVLRRIFGNRTVFKASDKIINTLRDVEGVALYPKAELFQELVEQFAPVTKRFDDRFGDRYCRFNFDADAEMRACVANTQPPQLTTEYLDALTDVLGRNTYLDGMTTIELVKALFSRIRARLSGQK